MIKQTIKRFGAAIVMIFLLHIPSGQSRLLANDTQAFSDEKSAKTEMQKATDSSKNKKEKSGSQRKRLFEIRAGNWRIGPGLAFKFGKGYNFTVGPKLNFRTAIDDNKSLNFSTQYLPLTFKDIASDGKLGVLSASANFRHFFRPRFFYELGVGLNSFRPDSDITEYVKNQGGSIKDRDIWNGSFSLAYQLFHISYSYKKRTGKIPFYLKLTWREGDKYEFGTNIGNAGDEYRNAKSGMSVRLYPLFRKF